MVGEAGDVFLGRHLLDDAEQGGAGSSKGGWVVLDIALAVGEVVPCWDFWQCSAGGDGLCALGFVL